MQVLVKGKTIMTNIDFQRHDLRWFLTQEPRRSVWGAWKFIFSAALAAYRVWGVPVPAEGLAPVVAWLVSPTAALMAAIVLFLWGLWSWLLPILNWWNRDMDRFRVLSPAIEKIQKLQAGFAGKLGRSRDEQTVLRSSVETDIENLVEHLQFLGIPCSSLLQRGSEHRQRVLSLLSAAAGYGGVRYARRAMRTLENDSQAAAGQSTADERARAPAAESELGSTSVLDGRERVENPRDRRHRSASPKRGGRR